MYPFDISKIRPTQFAPRLYCVVSTRSRALIERLNANRDTTVRFEPAGEHAGFSRFLFVTPHREGGSVITSSVINDLGDQNLSMMATALLGGGNAETTARGSLFSMACDDDNAFACMSGYWGILTHYWHHDADTFVCSNNVFLTAGIAGGALSEEALYDYLFFSWPCGDRTWFKDIHCLLPGQNLRFDFSDHAVRVGSRTDFAELLDPEPLDLVEATREFFELARNRIGSGKTSYLSLSSGSDSRTVLACMRGVGMKPHAVSFGQFNMVETRAVNRLSQEFGIPWLFVDLAGFHDSFPELFADGMFFSNGLLNPLRTHYVWLYSHLRRGNPLFEGIFGSEFIKGEIAIPAMASGPYCDVIIRGQSVLAAIKRSYPELPDAPVKKMADYIESRYRDQLVPIETSAGRRAFQSYLLENVPRRVFAGVISVASQYCMTPYYPFLSPHILQAAFSSGCGMMHSFSLTKDHVGPIASLKAEALIVRAMDPKVYTSLLDRKIRFSDVLAPAAIADTQRRLRHLRQRLTRSNLFAGQIDNSRVVAALHEPPFRVEVPGFPNGLSNSGTNDLLAKGVVTYAQIKELARG